MEVDSISQQPLERIEQIESADLVVGVVADIDKDGLETLFETLRTLPGSLRIVVLQHERTATGARTYSGANEKDAYLTVMPWSLSGIAPAGAPVEMISSAYQSIFAASEKVGARACCVIASNLEAQTRGWACQMMRPLLEEDFDLVSPYYARRTFEGLLNSSIIQPVTRCLYGKRIHNPMGPDLAVSRRLFQKMLRINGKLSASPMYPLASIAPTALCGNSKVGQVHVGPRVYSPTDWTNISSLLAQVLGPVFSEMERNAACWQRTRDSIPIPEFGEPLPVLEETVKIDTGRMINSFQLANRDLQEIWSVVLPPATLFDLAKVARLAPDQFRMADELWVRIIYDFALAHRLRTINRDHLLKSMTPLYLGWVASYAREVESLEATAIERRLERLCLAYEAGRPYLVSRWRWPDRFNP